MVATSRARSAAVGYSFANWVASDHTISPNTPPHSSPPRPARRATTPTTARPGNRAAGARRLAIVSAAIVGHLPGPGGRLGAVLGQEQLLQRRLPAQQLGHPRRRQPCTRKRTRLPSTSTSRAPGTPTGPAAPG